jgi:hypothetical protein
MELSVTKRLQDVTEKVDLGKQGTRAKEAVTCPQTLRQRLLDGAGALVG